MREDHKSGVRLLVAHLLQEIEQKRSFCKKMDEEKTKTHAHKLFLPFLFLSDVQNEVRIRNGRMTDEDDVII